MQRDRAFDHYQDLEARYELRPSAWVEPRGQWGKGRVELVQIPTPDETNDNIVAFWVPDAMPALRRPLDVEYNVRWQREKETPAAARVGRADAPRPRLLEGSRSLDRLRHRLRGAGVREAARRTPRSRASSRRTATATSSRTIRIATK